MDINALLNPSSPRPAQDEPAQAAPRSPTRLSNGRTNSLFPGLRVLPSLHGPMTSPTRNTGLPNQMSEYGSYGINTRTSLEEVDEHASRSLNQPDQSQRAPDLLTTQSLNGLNKQSFSRRDSDNSTGTQDSTLLVLNSAAPAGVLDPSNNINTNFTTSPVSMPANNNMSSPSTSVPALTPDRTQPNTPEGEGSMESLNPHSSQGNAFTAINHTAPRIALDDADVALNWRDELFPEQSALNAGVPTETQQARAKHSSDMSHLLCSYEVEAGRFCANKEKNCRKVISQVFGRNKAETRKLGPQLYVAWCRKHYQRCHYRGKKLGNWGTCQANLVVGTLQRMMSTGAVLSFDVALRNRETERRIALGYALPVGTKKPGKKVAKKPKTTPSTRSTPTITAVPVPDWMLAYCGKNKSFNDVLEIVRILRERNMKEDKTLGPGTHCHIAAFPDIEFLPNIDPAWNNTEGDVVEDGDEGDNEEDDEEVQSSESSTGQKRKRGNNPSGQGSAKKSKTADPRTPRKATGRTSTSRASTRSRGSRSS